MEPLDILFRWLHVGAAIILLGGSFFSRVVLMPAAKGLSEEEHEKLRERVMATWRRIVGIVVLLLLLSGFYNYLVVTMPKHKGESLYHALMGVKMILSFVVFFFCSALTGRSKALEGIRRNSKRWLAVTILLGLTIVAIAGFLKIHFS